MGLCDKVGRPCRRVAGTGHPHPPAPADTSGSLLGTAGPPGPVVHGFCLVCGADVLDEHNWIEWPKGNRFWVCSRHHPRETGGRCMVDGEGRYVLATAVDVVREYVPTERP